VNGPALERAARPLRVCIDARRETAGIAGGVEQIVIGLAHGLSRLSDGDEEYLFLTAPPESDWVDQYLGGRCRALKATAPVGPSRLRRWMAAVTPIRRAWDAVSMLAGPRTISIPRSDGTLEAAGVDVVHFPRQGAFLTEVPSVYQPHDLQHLHLPQHFDRRGLLAREVLYRAFCGQASTVVMMTRWGRDDIVEKYSLPRSKVCVVPGASVLSAYPAPSVEDLQNVRARYALPEEFALFPAQTFPHKNHLTLLEALALARDEYGLRIPLVASGYQNPFYETIRQRSEQLGLVDQLRFVGYVNTCEIRALYRLARCVVFPSTFEGWGLPVTEAFQEGVPVACADATSLPEVVGNAALLFPPHEPRRLAEALVRLWTDQDLRATLIARGHARGAQLTWTRTARIFRAHYRRIAGRELSNEDVELIAASCE
jgi:glycosyltransferase involved in cell wall biosynthesis